MLSAAFCFSLFRRLTPRHTKRSKARTARPPTAAPTAIPAFAPVESWDPDEAEEEEEPPAVLDSTPVEVIAGRVEVMDEVPITMTVIPMRKRSQFEWEKGWKTRHEQEKPTREGF